MKYYSQITTGLCVFVYVYCIMRLSFLENVGCSYSNIWLRNFGHSSDFVSSITLRSLKLWGGERALELTFLPLQVKRKARFDKKMMSRSFEHDAHELTAQMQISHCWIFDVFNLAPQFLTAYKFCFNHGQTAFLFDFGLWNCYNASTYSNSHLSGTEEANLRRKVDSNPVEPIASDRNSQIYWDQRDFGWIGKRTCRGHGNCYVSWRHRRPTLHSVN